CEIGVDDAELFSGERARLLFELVVERDAVDEPRFTRFGRDERSLRDARPERLDRHPAIARDVTREPTLLLLQEIDRVRARDFRRGVARELLRSALVRA